MEAKYKNKKETKWKQNIKTKRESKFEYKKRIYNFAQFRNPLKSIDEIPA